MEVLEKVKVVDDVLSSCEQEIYTTNSPAENCIEFENQMDRNCCVDLRQTYLASKLNFCKSRGYKTYNTKKRAKRETKVEEKMAVEE